MIEKLKRLFGIEPAPDFKTLVKQGGVIVDVRSRLEYATGHIKGSMNIPLDSLVSNIDKLRKANAVITCCASGMRSASAKSILRSAGLKTYNGGGWRSLESKLE